MTPHQKWLCSLSLLEATPLLRLRLLKVYLSWHSALQGPLTFLTPRLDCEELAELDWVGDLLSHQVWTLDINNPEDCGEKFRSNRKVGLVLFLGIISGTMLKKGQQEDKQFKNGTTQRDIEMGHQWVFTLRDTNFSALLSIAEIVQFLSVSMEFQELAICCNIIKT